MIKQKESTFNDEIKKTTERSNDGGLLSWKVIFVALGFVLFYTLFYVWTGLVLNKNNALKDYNLLFEADVPRVVMQLSAQPDTISVYSRHPLFILMVNPLGRCITPSLNPVVTSILFSAISGSLAVAAFFFLLLIVLKDIVSSMLFSVLFGLTSSQFIFSSIPETFAYASLSLVLMFCLTAFSIKKQKVSIIPWIIIGVVCYAITLTNIIQVIICYGTCLFCIQKRQKIKYLLIWITGVAIVIGLLSVLQDILLNQRISHFQAFQLGEIWKDSKDYLNLLFFTKPFEILFEVFRNVVMNNIVAPIPMFNNFHGVLLQDTLLPRATFYGSNDYYVTGWVALVLWLTLVTAAIIVLTTKKQNNQFNIAVYACLLFNVGLHLFFGMYDHSQQWNNLPINLFLFSPHWTCGVVILASHSLSLNRKFIRTICVLLGLFLVANNLFLVFTLTHTWN